MSKPRIRSIKPGFWTDGKIARISDSCALFYIGLWNFSDDEGIFRNDPRELHCYMPRWRALNISQFIAKLELVGCITLSTDEQWGRTNRFTDHQRISKPIAGYSNNLEILWKSETDSKKTSLDRIGKDRKGKDRIGVTYVAEGSQAPSSAPQFKKPIEKPKKEEKTLEIQARVGTQENTIKKPPNGSPVWEAYSKAYAEKYRVPPSRNAKSNALCSQLVTRLGVDEAPEVAAFYLSHNDFFYVKQLHPLTLLVKDAEKLRTEWKVGHKMTTHQAQKVELYDENKAVAERFLARHGVSGNE